MGVLDLGIIPSHWTEFGVHKVEGKRGAAMWLLAHMSSATLSRYPAASPLLCTSRGKYLDPVMFPVRISADMLLQRVLLLHLPVYLYMY